MKRIKIAGIVIMLIAISGVLINAVPEQVEKKITGKGTWRYFPPAVEFAGEPTPLNISDVRERFDRELLVNANLDATTLLIIKRANRAFPIIEPILAKYGVPDDFKYLAVAESGLMNAVSPSGAKGFWQFREAAAREHGLEVSGEVD